MMSQGPAVGQPAVEDLMHFARQFQSTRPTGPPRVRRGGLAFIEQADDIVHFLTQFTSYK